MENGSRSTTRPRNFLLITAICARDLPVAKKDKHRKILIEVGAGNSVRKTKSLNNPNDANASLVWNENIYLSPLESSTAVSLSLYRHRVLRSNELLSRCEVPLQEFVNDKKEITVQVDFTTGQSGFLDIHYESDIHAAMTTVLPESAALEGLDQSALLDVASTTQNVVSQMQAAASTLVPILQTVEEFKGMFDMLANIHPFASAAWSLLNLAYDALKNQNDKDQSIVSLYHAMMKTYTAASEEDILTCYGKFEVIFDAMLRQTMECAIFITGYVSKSYLRRFVTRKILEKVNEFQQAFSNLEKNFHERMIRTTATVSLGTYTSTQFIEMKVTLEALNRLPPSPPRASCLVGTRKEFIEPILCWIGKCEPGVLWVYGLAGSGKSTLASTIAEHARAMGGGHGRLGALIQFDRNKVSEPSKVITTLAWKLASFDDRIGFAIKKVVQNCSDINERPLSEQFRMLLIDTLESVENIWNEGPIVVMIDGLDECGALGKRLDLLDVLARGFGENLPMIRLIVMSRREEDIQRSFDPEMQRHVTALSLDVDSWFGQQDIRLYFHQKFREIQNDEFQQIWSQTNAADGLTKRANGHFIWAATVFEFVKEYPVDRLQQVLAAGESSPGSSVEGELDILYKIALRSAIGERGDDIKSDMIPLLGTIIVAKMPLSLTALDRLTFGSRRSKSGAIIEKLGSVASFGEGQTVHFVHKSFDDFLTDRRRSGDEWYVNVEDANKNIATQCLTRLIEHFTFNSFPGTLLPGDIFYALEFWTQHVTSLNVADRRLDYQLRRFFETSFLKWLEAVENLKVVGALSQILKWTNSVQCDEKDRKLRYHAYQFAERFAVCVKEDPSLTCVTALTFAPPDNVIRGTYSEYHSQLPRIIGNGADRLLVLCEHDQFVYDVAISPDGSKVVSGTGDDVMLRDAATGKLLWKPVNGHRDIVWSVAFSPDGSKIVSGSRDSTGRVWSTITGELLRVLRGHADDIYSVKFSPDGHKIISGSADCTVRLWDADTGTSLLPPFHHDSVVYSVAISPDGTKIASGSHNRIMWLWDVTSGAPLPRLTGSHESCILSVSFSPDGSQVVSGSNGNTVQLWDATTGASLLEPLQGYHDEVRSVAFVPDGSIVMGSTDKTIRVWQSTTGSPLLEPLRGHSHTLTSVAVSSDGTRIVSGSLDRTLRVWDVAASYPEPFQGHSGIVNVVAFSPDGSIVASGSSDKSVRIWDAITGFSRFGPIHGHDGEVTSVAFSPDGCKIVSGSDDTTIRVWSTTTGGSLGNPLRGHTEAVNCTLFSWDGRKIISASKDGTIRMWDAITGVLILPPYIGHNASVLSIAVSPDGSKLVSGSADRTVRVWEVGTGTLIPGPLQEHHSAVTTVVFSPDGSKIGSGSDDGVVRVWDSVTGSTVLMPFGHHVAPVTSIAFSLDSSNLISTSRDRTVRLWRLGGGGRLSPINLPTPSNTSLLINNQSSASSDGQPYVPDRSLVSFDRQAPWPSDHDQSSVSSDGQAPRDHSNMYPELLVSPPSGDDRRSSVSVDTPPIPHAMLDDSNLIIKFLHYVTPVSICIVGQAIHVAASSGIGELVILDVSTLVE